MRTTAIPDARPAETIAAGAPRPSRRAPGTTEIRTRAIESTVRGILRTMTTQPAIEPRAIEAHRDDDGLVVDVQAAVPFPAPASDTGRAVQRAVREALPRLTGEPLRSVHVTVVPTADGKPAHVSAWPGWITAIQRFVSALVAVALVAGSVIVIVDVIADLVGDGPVVGSWGSWYESARDTAWDEPAVLGTGFLLVGVGALLVLLAALRDGRSRTVALPATGRATWRVRRDDLSRDLERVVARATGLRRARARLSGDRVTMRVDTARNDDDQVREQVRNTVLQRRAELTFDDRADVRVEVRGRG